MSDERDYVDTIAEFRARIKISPEDIDHWGLKKPKLPLLKRIYKRLMPIRFEVNLKVKMYFVRKATERFMLHIDKMLAWGDEMPSFSKVGMINKHEMDRMRLKGLFE